MNEIQTIMQNKEVARIREEAGQTIYSTEEILGSMTPVKEFAKFYHNHRVDLDVVEACLLLDYCRTEFTSDEKRAYEKGLSDFLAFFEKSADEMERYSLESQKN